MYILGQKTYTTGIVNLLCVRNDTKESWNMSSNYSDLKNHMLSASRTVTKKSVRRQNRSGRTNFGSQNWSPLPISVPPSENVNSKQFKVASYS